VTIVQPVLDDVLAHAREEEPRECCGILLGTSLRIEQSVRARNLADGTTRFLIDPRDHLAAIRQARARTLRVVGFYHSHPRSRAYPSETDVAESGYAGVMHLIAGRGEDGQEARLFTIEGSVIAEIALAIVPADDQLADWPNDQMTK
jgi:proteasome lid subunit RPN8/RPN11